LAVNNLCLLLYDCGSTLTLM